MKARISVMAAVPVLAASCVVATDRPWQRDTRDLLKNFANMYNPCVVEVGGEYPYRMWFFGWAGQDTNPGIPGCDAIFHARSGDLRTWEVHDKAGAWDTKMTPRRWTPVLHAGKRWYEAWHVGDPSVVLKDGRFFMAYSATSKHFQKTPGYPSGMVQCIMGATSKDGVHWEKTPSPLLIRAGDAPVPKPDPNRIGDFHRPSLRWDGGRWRLWFDYWVPGHGVCMGHAECREGFAKPGAFRITHDLSRPLLTNWPNPEIIKVGGRYHAFGDPPGYPTRKGSSHWMSRQLREAVSADGLAWRRLGFIPPDADAEACHVPQALVTVIGGRSWLYLFYATQVGTGRGDGRYHFQYDRIRSMRRPIEGK